MESNCAETYKTGNIVHQGFPLKFWFLQTWIICIKGHGDQCGCKGGDWLRIQCIKVPSISEHHLFPQFLSNASISFQYFPHLHRIIFSTDWKRENVNFCRQKIHPSASHWNWKLKDFLNVFVGIKSVKNVVYFLTYVVSRTLSLIVKAVFLIFFRCISLRLCKLYYCTSSCTSV